jgi:hypothetical protein
VSSARPQSLYTFEFTGVGSLVGSIDELIAGTHIRNVFSQPLIYATDMCQK